MRIPHVPFLIRCIPEFELQARYTITMLGLIGGFSPRFLSEPGQSGMHVLYGYDHEECDLFLQASRRAHEFLLVKGVYTERPEDGVVGTIPVLSLFPGERPDILSAAFFFYSLHEEWSCGERDAFGRFQSRMSLLGALGQLDRPVIAEYAFALQALLLRAGFDVFTAPRFGRDRAAVCLTHDIDYVRKISPGFLYREVVVNFLGNRLGQPFSQRSRRLVEYLNFLSSRNDPYRVSLRAMIEKENADGIRATYFFKGGGNDKRDVRYSLTSPFLKEILNILSKQRHEIGIHPSFSSPENRDMMARELAEVMEASGAEVTTSRQHYLRLSYPKTFQLLAQVGITVDSSLGFAEYEGFRNGACHPFLPFDLERREVIPIWEIPLTVMDGTLSSYRRLSPEASFESMTRLAGNVCSWQGIFVVLFHNICWDRHDYPSWDNVFTDSLALYRKLDVQTRSLRETLTSWLQPFEHVHPLDWKTFCQSQP